MYIVLLLYPFGFSKELLLKTDFEISERQPRKITSIQQKDIRFICQRPACELEMSTT